MKPPLEQNYYELLEVPRDATLAEIDRAYDRARAYYGAGSVAVYALASPDELKLVQDRIDEAYLVLADEKARTEYDNRTPASSDERPMHREVRIAREKDASRGMTPGPMRAVTLAEIAQKDAESREPKPIGPPPEPVAELKPAPEPPKVEAAPEPPPPAPPPAPEPTPIAPKAEPVVAPAPAPVAAEVRAAPEPQPEKPPEPPQPAVEARSEPKPEPAAKNEVVPSPGPLPPPEMEFPEPAPKGLSLPRRDPKVVESAPAPTARAKPEIPSDAIFTGDYLKRLREAAGLSLQEVSDRTKIGKSHIENIEGDRYGSLPAQVYVRGFLMAYARELRLDPLRVSKSYLEQMASKQKSAAKP